MAQGPSASPPTPTAPHGSWGKRTWLAPIGALSMDLQGSVTDRRLEHSHEALTVRLLNIRQVIMTDGRRCIVCASFSTGCPDDRTCKTPIKISRPRPRRWVRRTPKTPNANTALCRRIRSNTLTPRRHCYQSRPAALPRERRHCRLGGLVRHHSPRVPSSRRLDSLLPCL